MQAALHKADASLMESPVFNALVDIISTALWRVFSISRAALMYLDEHKYVSSYHAILSIYLREHKEIFQ